MTDEKTVTLPASDVECLLLAAAAVKEIEANLVSMGRDPTFMRRKGHIEEAFDRINKARREETRVIEDPEYNEPPGPGMVEVLRMLEAGQRFDAPPTQPDIAGLIRRRMIVMGTKETYIKWGDRTVSVDSPPGIAYKLTERGRNFLYPTQEE